MGNSRQKQIALVGMGRTGQAAQKFLDRLGFSVVSLDDRRKDLYPLQPEDLAPEDLLAVLPSPGIPFQHPLVVKAREAGIPIVSDMDVFRAATPDALCIGVTGTNGKSTTTALLHHLLTQSAPHVFLGGNIGVPVLSLPLPGFENPEQLRQRLEAWFERVACGEGNAKPAAAPQAGTLGGRPVYVLELSSFQLAWSHPLGLQEALWTNLTPDHLDRHGTLEGYIQAKEKIFDGAGLSILGVDDTPSRRVYAALKDCPQRVLGVQVQKPGTEPASVGEVLVDLSGHMTGGGDAVDLAAFSHLVGRHNWQNMALAILAARAFGLSEEVIAEGIRSFQGLPHRLETVAKVSCQEGEIWFVNDSKATNAESTIKALESFPEDSIYLIAGGRAKSDGLAPAIPFMTQVKEVFLIGEATERFERELGVTVPFQACQTLEHAVEAAWARAQKDASSGEHRRLVLLSPACASFDQFQSYEERGDVFKTLVRQLLQGNHGLVQ